MTIYCLVDVKPTVPLSKLEREDVPVAGTYFVDFESDLIASKVADSDTLIEAAKDIFHAAIAIGNLDDFDIGYMPISSVNQVPVNACRLTAAGSVLPPLPY